MNEMDQNEPSKGTEMNRNVPTRAQLTKINQNRKNPVTQNALNGLNSKYLVTELNQMKQNES